MFELSRFFRHARAHWAEYRRAYAWFIAIGVMIHFVLVLVVLMPTRGYAALNSDGQQAIYILGMFVTAPIFAGRYFQAMSQRESALLALMRPASSFEKWLLAFLIVGLGYPVVYSLAYEICNLPAATLAGIFAAEDHAAALRAGQPTGYFSADRFELQFPPLGLEWRTLIPLWLSVIALQGFAVLGSLYFRSVPFIKTLVLGFVLLLLTMLVSAVFEARPDHFFSVWQEHRNLSDTRRAWYYGTWFALPALLWIASLLALQEREVA